MADMFEESALGEGWTVWNAEEDRAILAYRPDVFDGSSFPAPCLPTIYVARGRQSRRPEGNRNLPPDAPWLVRLQLEPEIDRSPDEFEARSDAIDAAKRLTVRFSAGEIEYRSLYQIPREEYLEKLDELTDRH